MTSIPSVMILPVAAGLCLLIALVGNFMIKKRNERISRLRNAYGEEQFRKYFEENYIANEVIISVYDYLSRLTGAARVPPMPLDSLATVFGLTGEDHIDAINELALSLGLVIPQSKAEDIPAVETVEELICFLDGLPRKRPGAESSGELG